MKTSCSIIFALTFSLQIMGAYAHFKMTMPSDQSEKREEEAEATDTLLYGNSWIHGNADRPFEKAIGFNFVLSTTSIPESGLEGMPTALYRNVPDSDADERIVLSTIR